MTDVDRAVYAERARCWLAAAQEHQSHGEDLQALGAYLTARRCYFVALGPGGPLDRELQASANESMDAQEALLRRTTAGLPEGARDAGTEVQG